MKLSKRFFSTLIAIAMLVTVITSFNITTVMATEAAQTWDWNAAISAGADLNAENSTSPFTIWEIKFANATADFGTFAPMVFAGGNYTGTNGARGLVLEKGTNVNGHYISPGCNTDTGAISGIAVGFTAPFDGVYTLTAVITLKDGNSATGSDNLYGGTIAEWYTLKGQDATVKDNFKQFNAAKDESVDFGATYELKEGETVYLVSDPNGNHGGDCAYLKYSVSGIEDTTVGDDNTGDDTPTVTPNEVWNWNAAISAGADLNAENSTSPFTIWEIKFANATADFGTFAPMVFAGGNYTGTNGASGLAVEKGTNANGHYISPGCNTDTGAISGIAVGFTAPFDGVYTLTAVITLKDGNNHTGSDNLYGGTIAEWYTLKGQDATVKDNFKQFNAAKGESVDFEASYELKEGETVYLVTDPNGNHWGDCAYLKYSVSGVEDTTPGDDNTGDDNTSDDTPTVTPNEVWNWNAAISAGNDLNAENSTSPFTIWEIKFPGASADFGTLHEMIFNNGSYKGTSSTLGAGQGLLLEKNSNAAGHYISPGCNTNTGEISGIGIGFTAPFDGVFTLSAVITLKDGNTHTGSDNLYGGTIAEWYTLKGQDAATKDNFKQFNGAALSAHDFEATYELKEGETVYLVTDPNGNHWGDCAYLKYSVSGIEDTTVGDDNTGDDNTGDDNTGDESNPGTSDTTASLVVTVAVVGAACGAFVALRGHKNH